MTQIFSISLTNVDICSIRPGAIFMSVPILLKCSPRQVSISTFSSNMTVLLTGSMIWEGLIVTRGPFNMFQNILDLFLPPTHLSLKKLILLLTCLLTIASCNCFFRLWYRADNCLPSSLSYGRVLFCKCCSRLASRLRFKILSRPLSQKFL